MTTLLKPPPPIDPAAPMIARTDRIVVDWTPQALKPLDDALEDWGQLPDTGALPGVVGAALLTPGAWGVAGGRMVHLSDGGSATEQILEIAPGERFRYQVWDYTTVPARPLHYAIGEFRYVPLDGGRTELAWTYAFRLLGDRFPGFLGPLGRWLLKVIFPDRAYAVLMRETLKATKAGAAAAA